MAAALPPTPPGSSGLIRWLAELAAADRPETADTADTADAAQRATGLGAADGTQAQPSFAARLGRWMDWTDAIALSAALDTRGAAPLAAEPVAAGSPDVDLAAVADVVAACARVRRELGQLAGADVAFSADSPGPLAGPVADSPRRRDYQAHQRAMDASIGPLRAQVRAALASRSPTLRQLAALDAAMDEALRPRERHLLAQVPLMLEKHFERLERLERLPRPTPLQPAGRRQASHAQDLQAVLLAELDLRFEPIDGMLEALRVETD